MKKLVLIFSLLTGCIRSEQPREMDFVIRAREEENARRARYSNAVSSAGIPAAHYGYGKNGPGLIFAELYSEAKQGDIKAIVRVAGHYKMGIEPIRKNNEEAFKWYTIGAEKGDGECMIELAECYITGSGTEPNPEAAYTWIAKANSLGISSPLTERYKKMRPAATDYIDTGYNPGTSAPLVSGETYMPPAFTEESRAIFTFIYNAKELLSVSDVEIIARFQHLQYSWNSKLGRIVSDLRNENITPELWTNKSAKGLEELRVIKTEMAAIVNRIKDSNVSQTLSAISDINERLFQSWTEIFQAVKTANFESYQKALLEAKSLAEQKAQIGMPIYQRIREKIGSSTADEALKRELRKMLN